MRKTSSTIAWPTSPSRAERMTRKSSPSDREKLPAALSRDVSHQSALTPETAKAPASKIEQQQQAEPRERIYTLVEHDRHWTPLNQAVPKPKPTSSTGRPRAEPCRATSTWILSDTSISMVQQTSSTARTRLRSQRSRRWTLRCPPARRTRIPTTLAPEGGERTSCESRLRYRFLNHGDIPLTRQCRRLKHEKTCAFGHEFEFPIRHPKAFARARRPWLSSLRPLPASRLA